MFASLKRHRTSLQAPSASLCALLMTLYVPKIQRPLSAIGATPSLPAGIRLLFSRPFSLITNLIERVGPSLLPYQLLALCFATPTNKALVASRLVPFPRDSVFPECGCLLFAFCFLPDSCLVTVACRNICTLPYLLYVRSTFSCRC